MNRNVDIFSEMGMTRVHGIMYQSINVNIEQYLSAGRIHTYMGRTWVSLYRQFY